MSIMDNLFQRTLEDLIKGLRLQLVGESSFISKALEEIRREIKSTDPDTKSTALQKLTYLNSIYAVDMSFAAFHVAEVMGSSHFSHKKIGYLAASQSFHDATDVILLITNQLRKDLTCGNQFEVCLALECLSKIATLDLARDLTPEVFTLLASTKIHVRKKAIAVLLRLFNKYSDAVKVCFKRLVENLDSSDPQSVSATVGVFCELTSRDPKAYLPLAPEFYRVLVDSKNNWVLIKVLKIFAKLAPLEPRLTKRVVEPICEHMGRTGAKSLMFECVRTIVTSLAEYESAVKLAVAKTREFLIDEDPNLKYLGLQALAVVSQNHLWAVLENKEIVIKCLSDLDPNIRLESLRLVMAMVSENNVVEMSRVLVNYALKSDPEFCNEIVGYILSTCSRNYYEIIMDFDWYVTLLGEISRIPQCQLGEEIESQLIDIALRVKDVRPRLVHVGRELLIDPALLGNPLVHRILSAVAWISGEYVEFSRNPLELIEALMQPRTNLLPPAIRAVYVHSGLKILIFCADYFLSKKEAIISELPDPSLPAYTDHKPPSDFDHNKDLYVQSADKLADEFHLESGGETVSLGEISSSVSSGKKMALQSLFSLVNLVEKALAPFLVSCEVELLERARNIYAFSELIKQELHGCIRTTESISEEDKQKNYGVIKAMQDALSEELVPVSISAQERVHKPDGLILNENLSELQLICDDLQLPLPAIFSLGDRNSKGRIVTSSNIQEKGDLPLSNESTSLLVEHRKRHGLYYLPPESIDVLSNEYPPANDSKSKDYLNDEALDLAILTEHSLSSKKKPTHNKPRPVVIKLDEAVEVRDVVECFEPKENTLFGAVRDVLHGGDTISTLPQSETSVSGSRRRGKERISGSASKNMTSTENIETGKSSIRKSKTRLHGKERRHRSPGRNSQKILKEKTGQVAVGPLTEAAETSVIPDFLL
uniref:Clathrin/coatomer adaptor adaptin-like N-terminal domain-containing protein n=1 Tax=Kalanchoe fedtschenkoi TaxID=63787 RepID=A0A7N1A5P4_KALFE